MSYGDTKASKAVGWVVSQRGGRVFHVSALDGWDVQAVVFMDELPLEGSTTEPQPHGYVNQDR